MRIFIISFRQYKKNRLSKFIFFYFPVKAYQKNIIELVSKLNKNDNTFAYLVYNSSSSKELELEKNSFFVDLGYLRFIPFANFLLSKINFIISGYVNYIFLPNAKNIYISHDIYDTPIVNKNIEKKLFRELLRLDYIFVSSNISKIYFMDKFKEYFGLKKESNLKIINTGYLKLDHIFRLLKKKNHKKDHILIAPTASNAYKKINLSSKLVEIIQFLIDKKYQVIYRPHPMDLTKKGNYDITQNIRDKFEKYKNFSLDLSSSYLESYSKSFTLITDFSGTAYTYSFSQNKPVLFFSMSKKKIPNKEFKKLYYFNDREKIGFVINNFNDLDKKLNMIKKNKNLFKQKINKLKKIRIKHFGNSLNITKKNIEKIL